VVVGTLLTILCLSYFWHRRKSQIQTYLEQNEGAGLQHLALKTDDIFETLTKMREAEENLGGFDLMQRPSDGYYRELPERLGDQLTVSLGASCV
jgi:4-hydroxyphenylpyruvate dioxygenase